MKIYFKTLETPIGSMFAAANDSGIFILDFVERKGGIDKIIQRIAKQHAQNFIEKTHKNLEILEQQLEEYFAQKRKTFDLPLQLSGTDFQQQVFNSLQNIPFGKTISYQQLSLQMNKPLAIRAIATANGQNCLAIIIPCHRVIGANDLLTGYSGGIADKKYLIDLEQNASDYLRQSELF